MLVPSTQSLSGGSTSQIHEKRFAYSLLEKLLEYVERASSTMQNYKESSKFSLHESYRLTTKDVKFFGKVKTAKTNGNVEQKIWKRIFRSFCRWSKNIFKLIEIISLRRRRWRPELVTRRSKKKKWVAGKRRAEELFFSNFWLFFLWKSLFCKLAFLLRQKFSAFGNEVNISVRCLKVLVRAIDVRFVFATVKFSFGQRKSFVSFRIQFGDEKQSRNGSSFTFAFVQQHGRRFESNRSKSRTTTLQSHQRNFAARHDELGVYSHGSLAGSFVDVGSFRKK